MSTSGPHRGSDVYEKPTRQTESYYIASQVSFVGIADSAHKYIFRLTSISFGYQL